MHASIHSQPNRMLISEFIEYVKPLSATEVTASNAESGSVVVRHLYILLSEDDDDDNDD